jgi:steroid delta-isomerase-like uncharacterized protein
MAVQDHVPTTLPTLKLRGHGAGAACRLLQKESNMDITKTSVELVKEAIEAFNAKDEAKLQELCAIDSTYTDAPSNREFKGHEEIFAYFTRLYTAFPDMSCRIVEGLPFENKVAVELNTTGTHTGALESPQGTFPPTGNPLSFQGFQLYTIKDGKITSTVAFYDLATIMMQLGLIPERAPVPA